MATRVKESLRLAHLTRSGSIVTPLEARRKNSVLRRLIHHVRTFSPGIGEPWAQDKETAVESRTEPPIAHRRPFSARGPVE